MVDLNEQNVEYKQQNQNESVNTPLKEYFYSHSNSDS